MSEEKEYWVEVERLQTIHIPVEASNFKEAYEIIEKGFENRELDFDDYSWDSQEICVVYDCSQ